MKDKIIYRTVQGVVFWALAMFGLRGVLPEAGSLPVLFLVAVVSILGFAVGPSAYDAYRCAQQCESTCNPSFCRV
jgi:hypothetical protein